MCSLVMQSNVSQAGTSFDVLICTLTWHWVTGRELYENMISTIEAGAFRNVSKIRYLYLDDNRLTSVNKGTFTAMPALEEL